MNDMETSPHSYPASLVVVFDLDDTLVRYTKRGAKVPRETWHALRRLHENGVQLYVVSYNPAAPFLVAQLGLSKYIDYIVTGVPPRTNLLDVLTTRVDLPPWFLYIDDRADNIKEIEAQWTEAECALVGPETTVSCQFIVEIILGS
ncbi:Hydrolase 3 incomplete domain containing protein [Pandoravirus salinus]|uniref:Hydrolase 3 incomplete domain containing protein n=1 Tax=Pandoravirus salinus TaxID=1349410 RepID=A0A291ATQ0_9VIRU|nr:Hydrolase 3 incomplete domain [Pandoravirus salinus]ATE82263.1 Hydrolase 3 incomplete domain containing protein [Pandoravirus salinus]